MKIKTFFLLSLGAIIGYLISMADINIDFNAIRNLSFTPDYHVDVNEPVLKSNNQGPFEPKLELLADPIIYQVTGDRVNLRNDSNLKSKIIGQLSIHEKVEFISKDSTNFIQIKLKSGQIGWAHKDYLKKLNKKTVK